MTYVGIDIAKSSFTVAIPQGNGYRRKTYPNTAVGAKQFIATLTVSEHHCVMEATGNYGYLLLYLLEQSGVAASLINPKQIKHFARMMMTVSKTDERDACMIALYGEKMNPPIYKMPTESLISLKQKRTVIRQLKKQLVAMTNLRASLDVLPVKDLNSLKTLNKTIAFLNRQIQTSEADLCSITSAEFDAQIRALTSIKGIGLAIASAIVVSTGGFTLFQNAKQFSRFIGICPTCYQSGTSLNIKGHINRNGDPYLRSLLYMASWTAINHNSACRQTYIRLRPNGKPPKVALIAVANKLLRQAFAVVTSQKQYIDGYSSAIT
jgi:transposase